MVLKRLKLPLDLFNFVLISYSDKTEKGGLWIVEDFARPLSQFSPHQQLLNGHVRAV